MRSLSPEHIYMWWTLWVNTKFFFTDIRSLFMRVRNMLVYIAACLKFHCLPKVTIFLIALHSCVEVKNIPVHSRRH